ncbi:hypothetical protein RRG08_044163 [Elysia crispata]|uniref:Uncharacterized protein n=1 Tax=Elysia crispata TaxID=231223 RepID=A0AAE0XXK9_9GAST|nr:hypothetical protein RRG08_044163 [Elysia crispata]
MCLSSYAGCRLKRVVFFTSFDGQQGQNFDQNIRLDSKPAWTQHVSCPRHNNHPDLSNYLIRPGPSMSRAPVTTTIPT